MKAIYHIFALLGILYLGVACCPQDNEAKQNEHNKKNFVEAELLALKGAKPFYWYQGKRLYLTLQTEGKQYVLCRLGQGTTQLPEGWREAQYSAKGSLYSGHLYDDGTSRYAYALLDKGEQVPEDFRELYRGDSYLVEGANDAITMSDYIHVELSDKGAFRDLAELAEGLDLLILEQNPLSPKQYTLTARSSIYPAWQVAHILHRHPSTLWASPDFLVSFQPAQP